MPLVNMKRLLAQAAAQSRAVGAFNVCSMETVLGVVRAAEEMDTPVILEIAQQRMHAAPLEAIGFGVNVDLLTRHVLSAAHSPRVRADLLVAAAAPQTARALRWAEQQAAAGLVVESAVLPDRAAALRYAEERGIGRVEFFGADSPTEKG